MRIDYVIIFVRLVSSGFRKDPALVRLLSKSDVMCCVQSRDQCLLLAKHCTLIVHTVHCNSFLVAAISKPKAWSESLVRRQRQRIGGRHKTNAKSFPNTFLPDNMYRIIQSYLTNRYFRKKYREVYSSLRQILAGVPQGSVLGPLLYLIYTADLPTLANWQTVQLPPSLMIPLS